MRATLFGIAAIALGAMAAATPASALPGPGGIEAGSLAEKTVVVGRRVVVGARCTTTTSRNVGPMGRVTIIKRRRCY